MQKSQVMTLNDRDRTNFVRTPTPQFLISTLISLGFRTVEQSDDVIQIVHPDDGVVLSIPTNPANPEYATCVADVFAALDRYGRLATTAYWALQVLRPNPGHLVSGAPPFGTRRVDGYLVTDQHEQAAMNRIQELRNEGNSLRRIAEVLTAEGFRPRRARQWYAQVVRQILSRMSDSQKPGSLR